MNPKHAAKKTKLRNVPPAGYRFVKIGEEVLPSDPIYREGNTPAATPSLECMRAALRAIGIPTKGAK